MMNCLEILLYYNALLFPTHLMCTKHLISERLTTYLWFQPGSVCEIYFILQVLLYTFNFLFNFAITEVYTHKGTFEYSVAYCGIAEGGGGEDNLSIPLHNVHIEATIILRFSMGGGGGRTCNPLHAVTLQWRLKYILVSVHNQNTLLQKKIISCNLINLLYCHCMPLYQVLKKTKQ